MMNKKLQRVIAIVLLVLIAGSFVAGFFMNQWGWLIASVAVSFLFTWRVKKLNEYEEAAKKEEERRKLLYGEEEDK